MKNKLFLLPIVLLLCSCGSAKPQQNQQSQQGQQQSNVTNEPTVEKIDINNYQRFIRTEVVNLGNAFQHNEKIVFSGALSFATYDVTVVYSGINWETANHGTYTLKLDIGGGGETIKINGNVKIENVVGTCTYRL